MTFDELRAAFGQVEREVFRLEVQQSYAGVADAGWEAWQAGRPLPQRTVKNTRGSRSSCPTWLLDGAGTASWWSTGR